MPNFINWTTREPRFAIFAMAALATLLSASADTAPNVPASSGPTGEWLVAKKIARIKIADCDGRLWGVVSWEAQPGTDSKNPDPALRSRPTLGMPVLLGMKQSKANEWEGDIYNSEDGRTYSASIRLVDANMLRVQGCVLGFLCGGESWTRFEPSDTPAPSPAKKPPASAKRKAPSKADTADDICSRVAGAPGPAH